MLEIAKAIADDPLAEVGRRIALRQELTEANKALLELAEQAGVITKQQRAIFMNWEYKEPYAGETEDDIDKRKEDAASSRMSPYLAANHGNPRTGHEGHESALHHTKGHEIYMIIFRVLRAARSAFVPFVSHPLSHLRCAGAHKS